jgi:hypothetical protein
MSSAVAVGGFSGVERAPDLVGEGYRDEACLQGRGGPGCGLEHEPAVEVAVAERAQLDFLVGEPPPVDVPVLAAYDHGAVWFEAWRMAEQGSVLEPTSSQAQKVGELFLHVVDHRAG